MTFHEVFWISFRNKQTTEAEEEEEALKSVTEASASRIRSDSEWDEVDYYRCAN